MCSQDICFHMDSVRCLMEQIKYLPDILCLMHVFTQGHWIFLIPQYETRLMHAFQNHVYT